MGAVGTGEAGAETSATGRAPTATIGYTAATSAGVLWGAANVMAKELLVRGYPAAGLTAMRSVVAFVAFAGVLAVVEPRAFLVPRADVLRITLFGLVSGAALPYCLLSAVERAPLGVAVALLYTGPPLAAVLAWLFMRERISGLTVAALLLTCLGVLLVSGALQVGGGERISAAGVGLGVGAGASFAIFIVGGRRLVQTLPASTVTLYGVAIGGAFLLLGDLAWWRTLHDAPSLTAVVALLIVGLAIVPTVVARLLYTWSMKTVGATQAGVLSTLEVVAATIAALAVYGETPSGMEAAGIGVILCSALLVRRDLLRTEAPGPS